MAQPIYLHSMWRTGSTALWGLFRQNNLNHCYYEPFHELLGSLDQASAAGAPNCVAAEHLHHPPMKRSYFYEYREILHPLGGVLNFEKRFPYDDYSVPADAQHPGLERYLTTLSEHAVALGKRPVFGFCRSMLRISWMRRNFPGLHLAILRHPHGQWSSYKSQEARGNNYFFTVSLLVFCRVLGQDEQLGIPCFQGLDTRAELTFYGRIVPLLSDAEKYLVFYALWYLAAHHAADYAMVSVELTALDRDRLSGLQELLGGFDVKVDLSAIISPAAGFQPPADAADIEAVVRAWLGERMKAIPRAENVGHRNDVWLASESLSRHVSRAGTAAEVSADEIGKDRIAAMLSRFRRSYGDALALSLRQQFAEAPRILQRGDSKSYAYEAADLTLSGSAGLRCAADGAIGVSAFGGIPAQIRTPPVNIGPGTYRVQPTFTVAEGKVPVEFAASVTSDLGNNLIHPYTVRSFHESDSNGEAEAASFELDRPVNGLQVDLYWTAPGLTLNGVTIDSERQTPMTGERPPLPVYQLGTPLSFATGGNGVPYLLQGFSNPEPWGIWVTATQADLLIRFPHPLKTIRRIIVHAFGFGCDRLHVTSTLSIYLNGRRIGARVMTAAQQRHDLRGEWHLDEASDTAWISLGYDGLVSPQVLGISEDSRPLGVGLCNFELYGE